MNCENCLKKEFCPVSGMTIIIEKSLAPHDHLKVECKDRVTALQGIKSIMQNLHIGH